ncbi:MAG: endonuclease [Planctomycetaceae bacterium]|nr:endonuclease [Planctomycetaceae bacterium]
MNRSRQHKLAAWTDALGKTLADLRASRGERQALKALLEDWGLTASEIPLMRAAAFDLAKESLQGAPRAADTLDWLEDIMRLLDAPPAESVTSEALFSPGDGPRLRIRRLLDQSRESVDICVFTITDDLLTEAIIAAVKRKVRVRIITDDYKSGDTGSDIERIRNAGAEIRFDCSPHHMHHKFAIFDRRVLLGGSYNWTRSAAKGNEENVIVTDDGNLLRSFSRLFDKLWDDFAETCPTR